MKQLKGIIIQLGNDDKTKLKLRAIAKHAEALADELDAIDNAWRCPGCDSNEYSTLFCGDEVCARTCSKCGQSIDYEELRTGFEGSD